MSRTSGSTQPDGRTARRDRNSDAVLDAVHELFVEGQLVPTVDEVAARSGVSARSVYRYFPDSQEMLRAALRRRVGLAEPIFVMEHVGEGTLDERIDRLVEHRLQIYSLAAPTIRAALALSRNVPAIARQVDRRRQQLDEQARQQFAPELEALPADRAEDVLGCLEVLFVFEAIDLLHTERDLPLPRIHRMLSTAVRALLSHG